MVFEEALEEYRVCTSVENVVPSVYRKPAAAVAVVGLEERIERHQATEESED